MSVRGDAGEAWERLKAETEARLREELAIQVRALTGDTNVEVVEEDGQLVAVVEGLKFFPVIGSKTITIKEAVTGIALKGFCPKCGEAVESDKLRSMGEVGRCVAGREPLPYHFCSTTSLLAEPPRAEEQGAQMHA